MCIQKVLHTSSNFALSDCHKGVCSLVLLGYRVYSGLQVSCLGEIGSGQLGMSLCKLLAFVLDSITY